MPMELSVRAAVDRARALPLGTRILVTLVLAFSGVLAVLRTFDVLGTSAGTPGSALRYPYLVAVPGAVPWTLLTAAFCETSIAEFVVTMVTVPLAADYLEQQWGAVELLRFTGIVVFVSNAIAVVLSVLLFVVFRSDLPLFGTHFHGLEALQTGFLVALAQLIPHHEVQLLGSRFRMHVHDLPMLYVGLSNVMCLLGFTSPFLLIQFGWLVSWVYLRFYQPNEMGTRGDMSDAFAFVHWFPPFVHKPLGRVCEVVHGVVARVGLVPRAEAHYTDLELNVDDEVPGAVPSGRAEAERRRAMALEALDQRMADAKAPLPSAPEAPAGSGAPSGSPEAPRKSSSSM